MECIQADVNMVEKSMAERFVLPEFGAFKKEMKEIFEECRKNNDGKVADYIPELAKADPEQWGVSICTIDG
jgi:glutaminase